MSFLSWLFPAGKSPRPAAERSGSARADAGRPESRRTAGKEGGAGEEQPPKRKNERTARREMLYLSVRDAMTRAGVLSASYKFKVLSLDPRGRQFLVMVDLAREGSDFDRFAEIEALIASGAKARYDIVVSAVYWRINDHVAAADRNAAARQRGTPSQPAAIAAQPAPTASQPPAAQPAPASVAPARAGSRFDPIQADEVAAFKTALAAGVSKPAAAAAAATGVAAAQAAGARDFDGSSKQGPQSYTLLTGFEDTELPDPQLLRPALSGSQYGDLN